MDTNTGETCARHLTGCDLLERCITRRHEDDWRELTRRYGPMIRARVSRILARHCERLSAEEVDERVQDFYLQLLATAGRSFRGRTDDELRRYFERVVGNLLSDHRRRVERRATTVRAASTPRWMAPQFPSPERSAMARPQLAQFLECCRQAANGFEVELKVRVMHLAFLDGCSSREIARRLAGAITPHQVDTMIFRLRRRLAREGFEVPRRRAVAILAAAQPEPGVRKPLSIDR